jgi:hypothetical protein
MDDFNFQSKNFKIIELVWLRSNEEGSVAAEHGTRTVPAAGAHVSGVVFGVLATTQPSMIFWCPQD